MYNYSFEQLTQNYQMKNLKLNNSFIINQHCVTDLPKELIPFLISINWLLFLKLFVILFSIFVNLFKVRFELVPLIKLMAGKVYNKY